MSDSHSDIEETLAMADTAKPSLGVTMGDPLGIGPEVTIKTLADPAIRRQARFVVFGMGSAMTRAAELAGIDPFWWRVRHDASRSLLNSRTGVLLLDYDPQIEEDSDSRGHAPPSDRARATRAGGAASFRFMEDAIAAAKGEQTRLPRLDGIITAPISKEAWALAGRSRYPGHTDLLATRFHAKRTRMMFVSPRLRIILATAHLPLMDIRNVLTVGRVYDTIDLAAEACHRLGILRPRIAVCGLNPHAGEGGLLGDEESRIIEPAILHAQQHGIDATGPFPADTLFRKALDGTYDMIVAMYHDQGLIPVKLLDFESAVNVTVGLPIVRTSPDHGTAYDIAGKNCADPRSMRAAIELAVRLATPASTPAA